MKSLKLRLAPVVQGFLPFVVLMAALPAFAQTYTWSTIAGSPGITGTNDGVGNAARFSAPAGVAVDNNGVVYVADHNNNLLRRLTQNGTNWTATTIAGSSSYTGDRDGTNNKAGVAWPSGIAVNPAGSYVYFSDQGNNGCCASDAQLRQVISPGDGIWSVSTLVSYPTLNSPYGIALNAAGEVFVVESASYQIDRVTLQGSSWVVTRIAGAGFGNPGAVDGTNFQARFNSPYGLTVDGNGIVYVADTGNNTIRKITSVINTTNWITTTIAGVAETSGYLDGTNTATLFNSPDGMAADTSGNVYVADQNNNMIRKLTPQGADWVVSTIGGQVNQSAGSQDGVGSVASFYHPAGLAVDSLGRVIVADYLNNTIRLGLPNAQTNPPPSLQMATAGGAVFAMWPVSAAGYVLQTTTNLDAGPWVTITNGITTNLVFSGPMTNGQSFYRLQSQ